MALRVQGIFPLTLPLSPGVPGAREIRVPFFIFYLSFIICPSVLCRILELPESVAQSALAAHAEYPLLVPASFVAKMEKGNSNDPLLLQILPQSKEFEKIDGFQDDPLQERSDCPLLQKYAGRALLIATDQCAIHCRFCFRRKTKTQLAGKNCVSFLKNRSQTPLAKEVILSGGDPLCLSDDELAELLQTLRSRPEVRRIRIHTRFPVVSPKRLTPRLLSELRSDAKTVYSMVLHLNHPREIDADFVDAMTETVNRGIPVFVQSVLLRNVNDDFETLFELYEKSISLRMTPYYLHQLDRVSGAAHFEVGTEIGLELHRRLRQSLPGYAVPRYVREVPGEKNKVDVQSENVRLL